jgi:spore germination cell wall hydrolase CwlJ-like protein
MEVIKMIKEDWVFVALIIIIIIVFAIIIWSVVKDPVPTNKELHIRLSQAETHIQEYKNEIDSLKAEIASLKEQRPTVVEQYNSYAVLGEPEQKEPAAYTEDDLYWLAKIVYAEAGEDIDLGQQAVANVVLNRVESPNFPNTIYDVIWQQTAGGVWQFSPCGDGRINLEPDERTIKNARLVLEGLRILPEDVLYFYMPTEGNRGDWIRSREVVEKVGVHRFCK